MNGLTFASLTSVYSAATKICTVMYEMFVITSLDGTPYIINS